ncbi:MAG: hypothetical protein ABI193_03150 [Minicystis sp.]
MRPAGSAERARALGCALVLAALALSSMACDTAKVLACDRSAEDNPTILYTEGTAENGVYLSSPWKGDLLYFPGGMHYDLEHKLGQAPQWISSYLSFEERGTTTGSLAQSTGNQVVILGVTDFGITLANDSCVDYWLLVSAGVGAQASPAP